MQSSEMKKQKTSIKSSNYREHTDILNDKHTATSPNPPPHAVSGSPCVNP